ncbi:MAG TPA: CocE/NonD family hydrolase [Streptosporangiaceae bacterium]|nr:CocE/NonD family hydrolase [Streptosporangiaceae bacterium]
MVRTPGEQLAKRMAAVARATMQATVHTAVRPRGERRHLGGSTVVASDGAVVTARHRAAGISVVAARGRAATAARNLGAAALRLPPGPHPVAVQRNLAVVMADGVTLRADRYFPADAADRAGTADHGAGHPPVILVRSPYGRSGFVGLVYGHFFARHGFQAVVQSVRGTFGSGGVFDPLGNEREDGLTTVAWLKAQPWFGGVFAMYGPSYLGYSQWAIAADAGPELRAMAAQMAASQFRDAAYVGGAFALESTLTWSDLTTRIERPLGGLTAGITSIRRARRAAMSGRPLAELDTLSAGAPVPFFQDLLRNAGTNEPYWQRRDHSGSVGEVGVPVSLLGGWYDVFLPWQLRDYAQLRAAGRTPQLTIGPWYHADPRQLRAASADALTWFRAHLLGEQSLLRRQPVRLFVTGAGEWRDYPDWPVPGISPQRWHLQPGRGLAAAPPAGSPPDSYRYDPAHPTPAVSGPTLVGNSEPEDNRRLEARRDVLTFTSQVLPDGLEIIGPVTADLYVRSSRAHTDVVVRVCDVGPTGASINVCEGVRRLVPGSPEAGGDGVRRVPVELWPAGHRFLPGHRVRIQVASGAYPRVDRNTGTGQPLGAASMVAADQEVFHDPAHPSAIVLPVTR